MLIQVDLKQQPDGEHTDGYDCDPQRRAGDRGVYPSVKARGTSHGSRVFVAAVEHRQLECVRLRGAVSTWWVTSSLARDAANF